MFKPIEKYNFKDDKEIEIFEMWTYVLNFLDFQAQEDWMFNSSIGLEMEFCSN